MDVDKECSGTITKAINCFNSGKRTDEIRNPDTNDSEQKKIK